MHFPLILGKTKLGNTENKQTLIIHNNYSTLLVICHSNNWAGVQIMKANDYSAYIQNMLKLKRFSCEVCIFKSFIKIYIKITYQTMFIFYSELLSTTKI